MIEIYAIDARQDFKRVRWFVFEENHQGGLQRRAAALTQAQFLIHAECVGLSRDVKSFTALDQRVLSRLTSKGLSNWPWLRSSSTFLSFAFN